MRKINWKCEKSGGHFSALVGGTKLSCIKGFRVKGKKSYWVAYVTFNRLTYTGPTRYFLDTCKEDAIRLAHEALFDNQGALAVEMKNFGLVLEMEQV